DLGISACLKHFPGQGDADGDTHDERASIDKTLEELMELEFLPFQAGIEAGVNMIMVSHLLAPEVIEDNDPSSLSEEMITDVLRGQLGYDGIVITDALNMSAITDYYGADEAAIKALKAGVDMLLMPEDFELAYQGVLDAVADGTISEDRIDDSLARIYRVKYADTISD
ncbi:MAG: glycoside hydrolase family 3 N-terminal domain-containing protein, partial [Eubacteriales bacterium]